MLVFIIFVAIFLLGFLISDRKQRKTYFAAVFAILCFPIGVLLALAKNYK